MPLIKRPSRDGLTFLPNRETFLVNATRQVNRSGTEGLSLAYMRFRNLESFSMRYGAEAGDEAIVGVAEQLKKHVSEKSLGRFSSGTFAALLPYDQVERIVEEINDRLPARDDEDGLALKAGHCRLDADTSIEEALNRSRYAYEDVRDDSPSLSRLFDKGLEHAYRRRSYCVEHLDDAIERGEIRAYAQPIIRVLTGMICEVETLARWESEEFGFLRPDEFVPELERTQLIHKLDAEVIRRACEQWSEASKRGVDVPFGINLSRLDFELCDMFEVVTETMRRYDVPVSRVHVEITESALAHSSASLEQGIRRFREAGFKLYLDDFGSGYSSLSVLEGTSFDVVKLDMTLLQEVEYNERARVIVADAVSMVKRLALQSLCEGVETEEQFLFLKEVGCEKVQGYYFSKPKSHEEMMEHLFETAELHELAEDTRYYDSIGRVNLVDGTRSSVQGIEAAHFLGTQPFAIMEVRDQHVRFMSANSAFRRFVGRVQGMTIEELENRLAGDLGDVRNKGVYAASKAMRTGTTQTFDFIAEGQFCTLSVKHIESSEGREAFLLEVLSVTKYSQFNDFKLLEQSLGFIYTLFKRIDLLDVTDNTWRNIYLNVPRFSAIRVDETPSDEVEAFCRTFIHPDDQERFREFYDFETVEDRLANAPTNHLADVFTSAVENNRYEPFIFMLIPVRIDGHHQYLSCMRDFDLDLADIVHERMASEYRVSDDVLLSGILEVTDRSIFWKDAKSRFLGANQRFLDYYGFSSVNDILGKASNELGLDEGDELLSENERRVLKGERYVNAMAHTRRADGQMRRVSVTKIPLVNDGRIVGLVGFFCDMGERE